MRVLVVSLFFPLPADNGIKMRTWSVLRALALEGHQVHLLCPGGKRTSLKTQNELADVCTRTEFVAVPKAFSEMPWKQLARLRSIASIRPSIVARATSPAFRRAISDCLAQPGFDAVLFEQSVAAVNLPSQIRVPFLIDFHNVDHIIYQRYAPYAPSSARRFYALLEMAKFAHWEMTIAKRAAAAWVCSEADASSLKPLAPALPAFVAPNVIDAESYVPARQQRRFTLLFQGGMDWYPNQDAVDFFLRAVFPRVCQAIPQAELVVAGKNPPENLRRRWESLANVSFTGRLADLRSLTGSAAVSIVPLRIGSGTRLKILEAAAMSKAIVSTRVGAEGLKLAPGKEILLADQAEEFAGAIIELLQNDDLRRQLGRAARGRVKKTYTLDALRSAVRESLAFVAGDAPAQTCHAGESDTLAEEEFAMPALLQPGRDSLPLSLAAKSRSSG